MKKTYITPNVTINMLGEKDLIMLSIEKDDSQNGHLIVDWEE